MRSGIAIAVCAVVALAGCSTVGGTATQPPTATSTGQGIASLSTASPTIARHSTGSSTRTQVTTRTPTPTPTATLTPTLDLPAGVDRSAVRTLASLPEPAREAFRRARDGKRVHLSSDETIDLFSQVEHVYADGHLWQAALYIGATAINVEQVTTTPEGTVVPYENFTAEQQRIFRKALNASDYYTVGPDEAFDRSPNFVRYRNRTYLVSIGHVDFGEPVLDVDPYTPETTVTG